VSLLTSWDLEPVDFQPRLFQRLREALFGLAAFSLAEHTIDHRLVARLQALGQHRLGGQSTAGVKIDAGIAEPFRAELILQIRKRRIAVGDDGALISGLFDEVVEGRASRVAHDLDAIRLGGHRLLELLDHRLRRPGGKLRFQFDAQGGGGLSGSRLSSERRAIAGVAAHLHIHDQAFPDRIGRGSRIRDRQNCARGDADQKQIGQTHVRLSLSCLGPLLRQPRFYSEVRIPPNLPSERRLAKSARRRCGSSAYK